MCSQKDEAASEKTRANNVSSIYTTEFFGTLRMKLVCAGNGGDVVPAWINMLCAVYTLCSSSFKQAYQVFPSCAKEVMRY